MGLCNSNKGKKNKLLERKKSSSKSFEEICKFYSFKQFPNFNNKITFQNLCPEFTEKSIFSFYLYDISCKGLKSPSNIFMLRIFFGEKILTDYGIGEKLNFSLKETIEITKNFHDLSDSYLMFELSTIKEQIQIKNNKKTPSDLINSNLGKLTSYASIKFDLLTLSIGSQLYDIALFGKNNIQNGRISFKIKSIHKNKIKAITTNTKLILYKQYNDNIGDNIKIKFFDSYLEKINNQPLNIADFEKDFEDDEKVIYKSKNEEIKPFRIYMSIMDFLFANPLFCVYKYENNEWKIFGFYPTNSNLIFKDEIEKMHKQMKELFNLLLDNKKDNNNNVNYILNSEIIKENKLPLI